ncbi:MAG TPA: 2-hydroxyglutaryl-CoA dehydratase, partial [Planctomycetaceae bacterium]|nr:2-hydroxyglutaryl-CoA dehydratase [Planctomycetaceae bacterium]
GADAVIELGGEDAKIVFLTGGLEERMNGSCAGGTGAFIDQMALLMNVETLELDALAENAKTVYPIASRCGVFAKTDVQPLLNQGAAKEDVAVSVFQAVVDQTVAGLAQGRRIQGKVVYLGGPLSFLPQLRRRFSETLGLKDAVFPENARCFVAIGTALLAKSGPAFETRALLSKLENAEWDRARSGNIEPLFESEPEYERFRARHALAGALYAEPQEYNGDAYLGIDAGSTTTKLALITEEGHILYSYYAPNKGSPVEVVREQLLRVHALCGDHIRIRSSAVTGYGEALIQTAFRADHGLVETIAHLLAARHFSPEVDYIIDIGGQDIKCFQIKDGTVDSIMLNEACSSGCGSFIETYASSMSYTAEEFAKLGLFAKQPSDLGSRCTVFMNSSIKQAQREGASIEDIAAGLSISVIKNVMYKILRVTNASALGKHIVVQGGTFMNDAILRALEREIGTEVTRPAIARLMGAYGAALYAKAHRGKTSSLMPMEGLTNFAHTSRTTKCALCTNKCQLTINRFGGRTLISGNRCERPTGEKAGAKLPNLYEYKYKALRETPVQNIRAPQIGMPFGLNMYELLPFWRALFENMGYSVVIPPESTRELYQKGQHSIPSDTVCYPAKLLHGQIEALCEMGVTDIFYPCMPYNVDEHISDNRYNCPVVAYYPELLRANMEALGSVRFHNPYFAVNRRNKFRAQLEPFLREAFGISALKVQDAADAGYKALEAYMRGVREQSMAAIRCAREKGLRIAVVAVRPYHADPEVHHGIAQMFTQLGWVVVSEDAVWHLAPRSRVNVLNQWTYHARVYAAARYAASQPDMDFVQLVSFGCGMDAVVADEARDILESAGRIYTQLKIDEISNLGAARIRLRSLKAAVESREEVKVAHLR